MVLFYPDIMIAAWVTRNTITFQKKYRRRQGWIKGILELFNPEMIRPVH